MRLLPPDPRRRRTVVALFATSFVVAMLLTAYFNTQVVSKEQYTLRAEAPLEQLAAGEGVSKPG